MLFLTTTVFCTSNASISQRKSYNLIFTLRKVDSECEEIIFKLAHFILDEVYSSELFGNLITG